MSIEVFFNRPESPIDLSRLEGDIRSAQDRLVVAVAWFTLDRIAQAIIDSPATYRMVLQNAADNIRGAGAGFRISRKLLSYAIDYLRDEPLGVDNFRIGWVGGDDFQEGILHHKFVAIDSKLVWTGSFNLTYQASKNYETLLRIEDEGVAHAFDDEADYLLSMRKRAD